MAHSTVNSPAMKVRLSTMWIFTLLNYIYCDVFTIFSTLADPAAMKDALSGDGGSLLSRPMLLAFAALMEIPMLMVLLARYLPFKVNRWANIVTGLLMSAVETASLFVGKPAAFYAFFAAIEIACTLLIAWFAWRWKDPAETTSSTS